jgi:dipeptidyl aminopeptidase/acylaminoacyl peptidase
MKKVRSGLFVLFCVTLFLGSVFGQKRAITEKDLFQFHWIGNPQLSPDGAQVAFVSIAVDEKREDYESSLWRVSINGGEPRRLTAGKHDTSPQWSPDGKFLAFVRTPEKDGKPEPPQIFILPLNGGEAWQLTRLPKGASGPAWSPDGKTLAFSSSTNAEDLARAACDAANKTDGSKTGKDPKDDNEKDKSKCSKPQHEPDIHVVTRAEYRANGEGYLDFSRHGHIWTVAFPSDAQASPQPIQLTSGDFDEEEIEWAPDGSKIYFISDRELEPYYGLGQNVIYSVPAAGGETSEVTRIAGSAHSISISRDGTRLAFLGASNTPIQSHNKTNLWVADLKGGATPRNLTSKHDWDIGGAILGDQEPPRGGGGIQPVWSADGKTLTVLVAKQGRANLERFDVMSGEVSPLTKADQAISEYNSNGSQMVAEISTPTIINDLFLIGSDGNQKRLTNINEKLFSDLNLTAPEEIWYKSFDGRKIQTWIQKPPDFDPKKKYPLILNIHGGPHAAYGFVFFHEIQWMAAKGYVVLYPNPRGSTSYDEGFGNIIQYHYPGDDFKDLMAGVDELVRRGYVDEKHLGVTGGSGGGLLTDWVVTHTDRFAGAVSQRDIADWAAWWYSADFTLFQPRWFRKPPFEDPQDYRDRSPITYISNVKTPLMLILGDADLRTPPDSGGGEMFRALKYRKIPTAMIRFPGETHELSRSGKPWHRVERLHHIVNWFDIYLQGAKSNEYDLIPPPEPEWEKTDKP